MLQYNVYYVKFYKYGYFWYYLSLVHFAINWKKRLCIVFLSDYLIFKCIFKQITQILRLTNMRMAGFITDNCREILYTVKCELQINTVYREMLIADKYCILGNANCR